MWCAWPADPYCGGTVSIDPVLASSQRDVAALHDTAEPGHDVFHRHVMALGVRTGCRVPDDQQLVAVLVGLTRRRFHADLSRNAAQDDRADTASTQLQVHLGTVERAPLAFGNLQVPRLHQTGWKFVPTGRQATRGERLRLVHRL